MRLRESGKVLGDIDLGGFDAESDYKLAQDFVSTAYVDAALGRRRGLFLGRKGSGKSALFTQLPRLLREAGIESNVVALTPDQYAWSALKQYEEQGLLPEQAHMNAWKLTLAIETAAAIADSDHEWSTEALPDVKKLRKFLSSNYGDELKPGLMSSATSIVKGLQSLNLSAFGFGLGFDKKQVDLPVTPAVIGALVSALEAPLREQSVVIELDRLDDSWDGSQRSQTLLVGLLKAAKDLNDHFIASAAADADLRVIVFLRSDIYEGLSFDDKDKHRSTEEHLVWTVEGLKDMLSRRLPENVDADGIFVEGEMRGRIAPIDYLIKRTFRRPREVLQFVHECLSRSDSNSDCITKDEMRAAEVRYSGWKVDDLKQEYSKVNSNFSDLLEALRQEVHRYDALDDLGEILKDKAPEAVHSLGIRRAMEVLFDASVIGIRLRGAGQTRFKAEDLDLSLPAEGAVYVHQSLHKGLSIVEARSTPDEV